MNGRIFVGPSGYAYPEWRGVFYPEDLPPRRFLAYAARRFNSIELNGTFYSLKSPAVFERWAAAVPPSGFVFAVKGSRFITHNKKLAGVEDALDNFFNSGVAALGDTTGPFLWQLPPSLAFDPPRVEAFLELLPHRHRHALEVRHPSYLTPAFYRLLERRGVGFVIADTAGTFPYAEEVTADFVYVRLHGAEVLYVSRYTDEQLSTWADHIEGWARPPSGRDVYVYFDNTAKGFAPGDAERLAAVLSARGLMAARPDSIAPRQLSLSPMTPPQR